LDIKPRAITEPWSRGLRSVIHPPHGEIAVYVAQLPSVRLRASGLASSWRDESAAMLGTAIAAEKLKNGAPAGDRGGGPSSRSPSVHARVWAGRYRLPGVAACVSDAADIA
jgi:vancomycin resistance protein VanJ